MFQGAGGIHSIFLGSFSTKKSSSLEEHLMLPHIRGGLRTLGLLQPFLTPRQHLRVNSHFLHKTSGTRASRAPAPSRCSRNSRNLESDLLERHSPVPRQKYSPSSPGPLILTFGLL